MGCPAGEQCNLVGDAYQCVAIPPPAACPKQLEPGAYVYLNNKPAGHGFDATPRVHGDTEFCRLIHGVAVNDCHLEGWPTRVACEEELLGGFPIWEFSATADPATAIFCHDDHNAQASCDHYGTQPNQDDPQTPTTGDTIEDLRGFEGLPLNCGLYRDTYGPNACYFIVAHGKGYIRACKPDGTGCGPWQKFDK